MSGWTYMLRCRDDSYYVGSTAKDVAVRVWEHQEGIGAVYTSTRRPVTLIWSAFFEDLREAQAMEWRVKRWSRKKKEALVANDWQAIGYWAKRPSARRPSRAAARPPQGDARIDHKDSRHPEVRPRPRAGGASKDGRP